MMWYCVNVCPKVLKPPGGAVVPPELLGPFSHEEGNSSNHVTMLEEKSAQAVESRNPTTKTKRKHEPTKKKDNKFSAQCAICDACYVSEEPMPC